MSAAHEEEVWRELAAAKGAMDRAGSLKNGGRRAKQMRTMRRRRGHNKAGKVLTAERSKRAERGQEEENDCIGRGNEKDGTKWGYAAQASSNGKSVP